MKKKILFGLSLLFGLMFINAGLNKFLNYMPPPANMPQPLMNDFEAMMEIIWLMPLIGAVEIVGGLLVIIPKTRAVGAMMILPILVGILLVHMFVDSTQLPLALLLTAVLIWIFIEERHKYRHLV